MPTPIEAALAALNASNLDPHVIARARAIMRVYDERWGAQWSEYEIVGVEQEFAFPLLNPETEAPSRSFDEAGKVDLTIRSRATGRVTVVEHKTSSEDIKPESDYWDRLRMDTQCSKYFLYAATAGHDVEAIRYDVIRKPLQRPIKVPILDDDGLKIVLNDKGERCFTKDGKKPRQTENTDENWMMQTRPETPHEYEERVVEVLRANRDGFFAQRDVPRLDSDLIDYMGDAWAVSQEILFRRRVKCWPRNPDACKILGTCEYFALCCGRSSVNGIDYRQAAQKHAELSAGIQASDHDLLTTSRTKCLHVCARKHQLRYEQGVECTEVSEALTFGTLMHSAWEKYFKTIQANQNQTSNEQ
jgi:hypothetical protein